MKYISPEEAGFSTEKLQKVDSLYNKNGADALLIIYKGNILFSKGDISRRFDCHSIRKSLLSAVYGLYSDKGLIDINKTLNEIGIDDIIGLTELEKSAKIEDLLKSKSGIYIPALGETKSMSESRPQRSSHKPGEFYYYNNWDFNALNTIFQKETGIDVVTAFYESIAQPIGMEDYRNMDSRLWLDSKIETIHPKYDVKISARDLARFGLLYCDNGLWGDKQVISKEWISNSFKSYSHIEHENYEESYGYMWWIRGLSDSISYYSGRGWGGHLLTIIPALDIVLVKRHDTYKSSGGEKWEDLYINTIINAKTSQAKKEPDLLLFEIDKSVSIDTISLSRNELLDYVQVVFYKGRLRKIHFNDNRLIFDDNFIMQPVSNDKFYIEDYDMYMYFTFENNKPKFDRIE
jgi:CubicO group peptidase (beta-lactamase class C family)